MKQSMWALLFGLITLASSQIYASDITIGDPWIQEAPPTSKTLAGYLVISNKSAAPVLLESAVSEDFGSVEIHSTEMHDGMVHMNMQHDLKIDAGASFTLKPGGYHLMLINRKRSLRAGDKVMLELHFSNGEVIDINAEVRK